jgi:type VI protein secretion system component Hcp
MKKSVVLVCAILFAASAWGQNGRDGRSTITVTVNTSGTNVLSCTTPAGTGIFNALSWGFGASEVNSNPTGGAGGSTGKATLTDVTISKRTDSCSPLLFGATVRGLHIAKVTILQQDSNKDDVFEVVLDTVSISNYQISGDESHEVPTEQISFRYTKITLIDKVTGTQFGWDLTLGKPL